MRRLGYFEYVMIGLLLLAFGFLAGASVRNWAQAKNTPTTKSQTEITQAAEQKSSSATVTALFSPEDNIQKTLVNTINNAQRNILVQAYLFTDERIGNALIAAHKRGVNVEILLDSDMALGGKNVLTMQFFEAGIPVRLETHYENAHNKIMIFDHDTAKALVVTGSYNFTYSAQKRNAENVVMIRNAPAIVARYVDNWRKHAEQAMPYAGNPIS